MFLSKEAFAFVAALPESLEASLASPICLPHCFPATIPPARPCASCIKSSLVYFSPLIILPAVLIRAVLQPIVPIHLSIGWPIFLIVFTNLDVLIALSAPGKNDAGIAAASNARLTKPLPTSPKSNPSRLISPTNFNPVPASPDTPPRTPPIIPGANEAVTPPKSASAPIT